jgi:hypothetical protein
MDNGIYGTWIMGYIGNMTFVSDHMPLGRSQSFLKLEALVKSTKMQEE